jgi:Zn finger protein HypA/HybF involved in hydrogenase expression
LLEGVDAAEQVANEVREVVVLVGGLSKLSAKVVDLAVENDCDYHQDNQQDSVIEFHYGRSAPKQSCAARRQRCSPKRSITRHHG